MISLASVQDKSELDMISTRVMDIKLREAAEGLGEDST
ncbi:KIAA1211L isoform 2, partial [Pan troglodytes]